MEHLLNAEYLPHFNAACLMCPAQHRAFLIPQFERKSWARDFLLEYFLKYFRLRLWHQNIFWNIWNFGIRILSKIFETLASEYFSKKFETVASEYFLKYLRFWHQKMLWNIRDCGIRKGGNETNRSQRSSQPLCKCIITQCINASLFWKQNWKTNFYSR